MGQAQFNRLLDDESGQKDGDHKLYSKSKDFSISIHPKAKLLKMLDFNKVSRVLLLFIYFLLTLQVLF